MRRPDGRATQPRVVAAGLVAAIRGYQRWISPALGDRCRFYPSCSAYALDAIRLHGALRGCWLATRRLVKCQPFHPGGVDHVPEPARRTDRSGTRYGEVMRARPPKEARS